MRSLWPKLLVLFITLAAAFISLWSSQSLSATADEPLHLAGAHQIRFRSDYRINREDPAGWQHLIGLALKPDDLSRGFLPQDWRATRGGVVSAIDYYRSAVFPTGVEAVYRARIPSVILFTVLSLTVGLLTLHYFGTAPAILVAILLSFDPTFVGQSALIKNDVASAASYFLLIAALYWWINRPGVPAGLLLSLSCSIASIIKFSGLGMILLSLLVVIVAAIRSKKALPTLLVLPSIAICCLIAVWTTYGWSFAADPEGRSLFNIQGLLEFEADQQIRTSNGGLDPTASDYAAWRPGIGTQALLWVHSKGLLPDAYIAGLLYTRAASLYRPGYLMGEVYDTGHLLYFPAAVALKTPIGTLAVVAAGVFYACLKRRDLPVFVRLCIVGTLWYLGFALSGAINIGLRHLLPIYPLVAVIVAWAISRWWSIPRARGILTAASALMVLEIAIPQDRIAFFNVIGRAVGPIHLLGDSNLDWGQHLSKLARWQQSHHTDPIYLCYFGSADPASYGVRYENVPGSWAPGKPASEILPGRLVAISGTHLQGIYLPPPLVGKMKRLRLEATPTAILGGTIFLYRSEDYARYMQ